MNDEKSRQEEQIIKMIQARTCRHSKLVLSCPSCLDCALTIKRAGYSLEGITEEDPKP